VQETGLRNRAYGADRFGFKGLTAVHWNHTAPFLYERALGGHEATVVDGGALCAETGAHTGRSPKDKHTVVDALTENTVWWGGNRKITPENFQRLYDDFIAHARGKTLYAQDLYGGADPKYRIKTPAQGVMPMHCSANVGKDGDVALFFGLSGTGKTTLSADPNRVLIGDDEHGWGPDGVFNFEGGCYAKCIKLRAEAEPEIYAATNRFGAVLENVAFDPDMRIPNFDDEGKTENTRSAYPLEFMPLASRSGRAGHPKIIIFLTADAFGVMPPIAKLTPAQAMYHFLSGYTAKVAGTEKGLVGVEPEFSTCFAAPFLPRPPAEYGKLMREYISRHKVDCWLVNSGWTGGIYGVGRRMPIKATRALVTGALDGSLKEVGFRTDPYFGFAVPTSVSGVEPHLLYPMKTWKDKAAFDETARKLVRMFQENFVKYEQHVDADVRSAAPEARIAAE
jgi:phosphoenolpyruvate carboxykinase (ATP)